MGDEKPEEAGKNGGGVGEEDKEFTETAKDAVMPADDNESRGNHIYKPRWNREGSENPKIPMRRELC